MKPLIMDCWDGLFDSLVMPSEWPAALDGLARSLSAAGCTLFPVHVAGGWRQRMLHQVPSTVLAEVFSTYVNEGWQYKDVRAERTLRLVLTGGARAGTTLIEDDIISRDERRTLPSHQDFYRRFDLPWWAVVLCRANGDLWALSVLRSTKQGPVTPDEAERWATCHAHLGRLIRVGEVLTEAQTRTSLDLLEAMATPAMALNWSGKVLEINRSARALLSSDLFVSSGKLRAADRESEADLQSLLSQAISASTHGAMRGQPAVVMRRDALPLLVDAFPLRGVLGDVVGMAGALVLFHDPSGLRLPFESTLQRAFGLTLAESRLARRLMTGATLDEIASATDRSRETLRIQLRAVLQKTDTSRQHELVALLSRLAAGPGRGSQS